eukprot:ctg_300.g78
MGNRARDAVRAIEKDGSEAAQLARRHAALSDTLRGVRTQQWVTNESESMVARSRPATCVGEHSERSCRDSKRDTHRDAHRCHVDISLWRLERIVIVLVGCLRLARRDPAPRRLDG